MKKIIAIRLSQINIFISVVGLILILNSIILEPSPLMKVNTVVDIILFLMMWAFILITPFLGLTALIMGDKKSIPIRSNYILLSIWIVSIIWLLTLTF
jgi:hypothetical protein